MKTFRIPSHVLEKEYWNESGFCLSCKNFFPFNGEIALANKCPFCNEKEFYDIDFLIKIDSLVGIS